jgi:hypothetical protein
MNVASINTDVALLENALAKVRKTQNAMHFNKSAIITVLIEQINHLKEKRERQIYVSNSLI